MKISAYDIGGANIKKLLAEGDEIEVLSSEVSYFPFWKKREQFEGFLRKLNLGTDLVGITMTAELCDCFSSKAEGVDYITSICEKVFNSPLYLSIDGELLKYSAIQDSLSLAATNFVASLAFLEDRFGKGLLLDVGSTTTDIVPFERGKRLYEKSDLQRLQKKQLVYTGFLRTPVNSIVSRVPYNGKPVDIASEAFAITADVYNILGMTDYPCDTPDGKGKDVKDSMCRVARLLCADLEEVGEGRIRDICDHIKEAQVEIIAESLLEVAEEYRMKDAYICGVGKALAEEACKKVGIEANDLSMVTSAHENLPCLGLAWMVLQHGRG
ncbi:MAG: hydantoinase/oxoprolinase family protein [Candidatus Hydrothermarchaeales archaeon]